MACHNEDAQCAFVVDKILELSSTNSIANCSYGSIAVLYRRQVMLLATFTYTHAEAISNYLYTSLHAEAITSTLH